MALAMLSAEEVADILGLHVRTVRGYMREGRLPAVRIGKQYRIAERDLRDFVSGASSTTEVRARRPRLEVTAVVHIDHVDRHDMDRLSAHVMAAANSRGGGDGRLNVQTVYDDDRESLKLIVVGDAEATAGMLSLVSSLVGEGDR
jgi:excisionase family DNA binding protein